MLIWFSLALSAVFLIVATINVLTAPRLSRPKNVNRKHKQSSFTKNPAVSVLIPARNEAHQIRFCVESLLANEFSDLEIIVGDDQSSDGTAAVVEALMRELPSERSPRLRLLKLNTPPPRGWTGKARTCFELAKEARGDVVIFCDADVVASPDAVAGSIALLDGYKADLVSALPRQLGGNALVQALVAIITQFSILISLPLFLVPRSKNPALASGNGQWMAWRRQAYDKIGGHESVKSSRIEDVELARLAKTAGCSLVVAFAAHELTVRMYENVDAARQGFRKNLFALLGDSTVAAFASLVTTLGLLLTPLSAVIFGYYEIGIANFILYASLLLAQRLAFATSWTALLQFPAGIVAATVVLCESVVYSRRGALVWKDRSLSVE